MADDEIALVVADEEVDLEVADEEDDIENGLNDLQVDDEYGSDGYDYDEGPDRHTEEWYAQIRQENPEFTDDEMALQKACFEQDLEVVRRLLDQGVNPNFSVKATSSPLFDAIVALGPFAEKEEHTRWKEIIYALLDKGANPNTTDVPMLMIAFDRHDMDVINRLLDCGANPNGCSSDGSSLLSSAFSFPCHKLIVPMLIDLGADVSLVSPSSGWSALHAAASHNRTFFTQLVIKSGCVASNKDKWAKLTPLNYVLELGDKETLRLLMHAGYNVHKDDDIEKCIETARSTFPGDDDLITWFVEECNRPAPLKRQCRTAIRGVIGGVNLVRKIKESDIPEFLKPYLLLDELV